MKKWFRISPWINTVLLVLLFAVCPPAPAHSQELEDVYIREEQTRFKLEKGKRYHGKWTSEYPSAEKPRQRPQADPQADQKDDAQDDPQDDQNNELKKEQALESPPLASESEPAQDKEPEPEAGKDKPAEPTDAGAQASYEKLQRTMQAGDSPGTSGELASEKSQPSIGHAPAAELEISDQPGVLSCKYMGLVYEEGRAMVRLKLTNNSEREIQGIRGGFRIMDMAGNVVRSTGVSDTVNIIKPGEALSKTLFGYLDIGAEALNALKGASGKVELVFEVDSVGFTDGSKVEF